MNEKSAIATTKPSRLRQRVIWAVVAGAAGLIVPLVLIAASSNRVPPILLVLFFPAVLIVPGSSSFLSLWVFVAFFLNAIFFGAIGAITQARCLWVAVSLIAIALICWPPSFDKLLANFAAHRMTLDKAALLLREAEHDKTCVPVGAVQGIADFPHNSQCEQASKLLKSSGIKAIAHRTAGQYVFIVYSSEIRPRLSTVRGFLYCAQGDQQWPCGGQRGIWEGSTYRFTKIDPSWQVFEAYRTSSLD